MGKQYKCRFKHCLHEENLVSVDEAVKVGSAYYHEDCYKVKTNIDKTIDLFAKEVNPNVIFSVLRRVINNIVFDKNIDSEMLLFGLKYYIDENIPLNYPQGLYYVVQNKAMVKAYEKKKMAEYMLEQRKKAKENPVEEIETEFTYKPSKRKNFSDILM